MASGKCRSVVSVEATPTRAVRAGRAVAGIFQYSALAFWSSRMNSYSCPSDSRTSWSSSFWRKKFWYICFASRY